MSMFLQLCYSNLDGFNAEMSRKAQYVDDLFQSVFHQIGDDLLVKYDMDNVIPRVLENIKSCISSQLDSKSSATMTEEQLFELFDSLLVNLRDLPKCCAKLIFPLMTQYEVIQHVCGNIRYFHGLKANGFIEQEIVEYVLPQFQLMAERVGRFCFVLLADQLEVPQVNSMLAHLLVKIIPVKLEVMYICFKNLKASKVAEVGHFIKQLLEASPDILREYLIHLQEHLVNAIIPSTSTRNIHVMIEFLLIILTDVPNEFVHHDKLFDLLARVGALTREVSVLVCNLEENKSRSEVNTSETTYATLDLPENIELLKRDLKHVYLKAPDRFELCFPMSDGSLFMTILLINLNDLLNSNAYSVALIKEEIRLVKKDLEFIGSLFWNVEQQKMYRDLWTRVLDVAYEAQHAINSILVRDHGLLQLIFLLPDTVEKVKLIKKEVTKKTSENWGDVVNSPDKPVKISESSTAGQIIIGFEAETQLIIRQLTSGPAMLDVISIIGMPGSGKTTLAHKVYQDESVASHFDIRAWCTVGKEYDRKKMLQKIYNVVTGSDAGFSKDFNVDKLRKCLFGKRYLIVLDDMRSTEMWDDLTRPFPDVRNRSRIVLTSQTKEIALHGKLHSYPLYLRLLTVEESWELIEKRVFGEECCPDELKDVGKELALKGEGLPLVLERISRVLARREKEKDSWLEVLHKFKSFIFENEEDLMKEIQSSYDQLPDHWKLCLLYLASYPKDKDFKISALEYIWCAEGVVKQNGLKSVEEVIKGYLDGLISSSLVKVRGVRDPTYRIHDLVHDFCLLEARKQKLFDFISSSAPTSSDLTQHGMTILLDENSVILNPEKKNPYVKHLLTLKVYDVQYEKLNHLPCNCHLRHLRLLKRLELHKIRLTDSLLNEIGMLVHLRCLKIQTTAKALPPSFSNLWNLETLVVVNRRSRMVLSPRIWSLTKLRHISMDNCSLSDPYIDEPTVLAEDWKLENLRILYGLNLFSLEDTEYIFKRFPNLRSLTFSIREPWPCSADQICFPRMHFLNELEEVSATFCCAWPRKHTHHHCDFHFSSRLETLKLTRFNLTSDSLSRIGSLPNLENLSLFEGIFQGGVWNMDEEGAFPNLKFLELDRVSFSKWVGGEESFPVLEELQIKLCNQLIEIPPAFGDIYSLKFITLHGSPQLEESALKIKQYVEELTGVDGLEVIIY
ncbi:LOW QUALITY PROTEIN: putative late blight resistance protein homolog R1A-3 [Lycium ferocissimum]|uniref:LOW QUALITY PROTEIN: putative late blight resistance protein homolog R1A-3 n=1 Tax=Lycium ferocissimum TaxID=112874 RepID=UPI0028150E09|nr:LOW QUALITY PROTEIN: putative late blight resistance protein homolog R1A-3 [Lycium ferocissimum]